MIKTYLKITFAGIAVGAISLITSCKKSDFAQSTQETSKNSKLVINSAGDNKYDLLGFGYDVTGEYASSNSTTFKVIDIDKLALDMPDNYVTDLNVSTYSEIYAGGDASDYSQSLSSSFSTSVTYLDYFSGTFSASFKETGQISSKYSYGTSSLLIRQKRLKFSSPISLIKSNYLTAQFKADLNSMSAQQLVTKYGTHVLTDIILGAKLNAFYRSQTTSSNKSLAVKAGMNASVLKIFSISNDIDYSSNEINSNYNQTLYYSTVGGDGTKGLFGEVSLDNSAPKINIGNWQSSCTRDNAAFIQIGSKDSLIPLSDLIDDATKKQAVQNYITQYLTNKQVVVVQDPAQGSGIPADWASRAKFLPSGMPVNAIFTGSLPILSSNGNSTIYSQNHIYRLVMQSDGNLVLYNSANKGLWSSSTVSSAQGWTYRLYYQTDGNMVLKKVSSTGAEADIWASNTEARVGTALRENARRAYFVVQDDGNVALYYNGLDNGQYSLEFSTGTAGGVSSNRVGRLK